MSARRSRHSKRVLEQRQAAYDRLPLQEKDRRTRPGSQNPHKNTLPQGRKR